MDNETWSRDYARKVLKENLRALDGEYDDEHEVFFDVRYGDESLVVKVTDATDDTLVEEFIVSID